MFFSLYCFCDDLGTFEFLGFVLFLSSLFSCAMRQLICAVKCDLKAPIFIVLPTWIFHDMFLIFFCSLKGLELSNNQRWQTQMNQ